MNKSKKEEEEIKEKKENRKKETQALSIKEGAFASVASGLGNSYITPFALALNANNAHIGILHSLVGIFPPVSQLYGSRLMEKISRRKILIKYVALQALMWFPILLLGILFLNNIFTEYLPIILIIFYTIYAVLGSIAGPAWFSLMGDVIPEKHRGRYFGMRNRITGTALLISTLAASFFLDYFKTKGLLLIGFSILFFLAGIFRLISASYFKKHYNPEIKIKKKDYFSLLEFIKSIYKNNFGKLVLFIGLLFLAQSIAGPFFAVYMLKDLEFSYRTFMLVILSSSIVTLLMMPIWGKFADKYGNKKLISIGAILVPFTPVLWVLSKSPLYFALVPQVIGGIGWAAVNLGASNYIYDAVTQQKRGLCVAYFNIFRGGGIFIGAFIGGLLAQYLTITFMNKLLVIFLISGVLRAIVVGIMVPKIKEVRKVSKFRTHVVRYGKLEYAEEFAHEMEIKGATFIKKEIDKTKNIFRRKK